MSAAKPYATPLAVVSSRRETPADAAKRLQAEAEAAASRHVDQLIAAVNEAERLVAETVELGAVKPGIRDLCRQEGPKLEALVKNIASLSGRA